MRRLRHFFSGLTEASFARHGPAYGTLLVHWPALAGAGVARIASPASMRWPAHGEEQRRGGTLTLQVMAGHALILHHQLPELIERINVFFGYELVTAVRIKQTSTADFPMPAEPRPAPAPASLPGHLLGQLADIADERLRSGLTALGQTVAGAYARGSRNEHPSSDTTEGAGCE